MQYFIKHISESNTSQLIKSAVLKHKKFELHFITNISKECNNTCLNKWINKHIRKINAINYTEIILYFKNLPYIN